MNILYLGDVMGAPGIAVVEKRLPALRQEHHLDLVIAQAENVSEGKSIVPSDMLRLQKIGVDFFTGGNHTLSREDIVPQLSDPGQPIIRPANYLPGTAGLGYKYVQTAHGKVLVISLLGKVVGRDADLVLDNPLHVIDTILEKEKGQLRAATIVNFHGDYSSEKKIIGHYLDGRVTYVVGDHWHVQTADADRLPKGTAHITDVGMCGSLDSSLGVTFESVLPRWRDGVQTRNVLATTGRSQFNALLATVDESTGRATSAEHIRQVW